MSNIPRFYSDWMGKNAAFLLTDAEKTGYQKLVSSALFKQKLFKRDRWRSSVLYFILPHLLSSLYEIDYPPWVFRLGDAPLSTLPVSVDHAHQTLCKKQWRGEQQFHLTFDDSLLKCVKIILDAIDLDAQALASLIPPDGYTDDAQVFFHFNHVSNRPYEDDDTDVEDENPVSQELLTLLQQAGGWTYEEITDVFTSLCLFIARHLSSNDTSQLHEYAWLILKLMPVAVMVCLMSASNERPEGERDSPFYEKLGSILKCAYGRCFYQDLTCKSMPQVDRYSFILREAHNGISRALCIRKPKASPDIAWDGSQQYVDFGDAVASVLARKPLTGEVFNETLKSSHVLLDFWEKGVFKTKEISINKTMNWMVFEQISGSLYVLDQSSYRYTDQNPIETWNSIRGSNLALALHNTEKTFDGFIAGDFLRKQEPSEEKPVLETLCRCIVLLSNKYAKNSTKGKRTKVGDRTCYEIMAEDFEIVKSNSLKPNVNRPRAGKEI